MPSANAQNIESALEDMRNVHLPDDVDLFALEIQEDHGIWEVVVIFDPFSHIIPDGHPYPASRDVPSPDLEFSSKEEALDFAQKLHDVLVERGKQPEGNTTYLFEAR